MKTKKVIGIQVMFLIVVAFSVYFLYPKVDVNLSGNLVKFSSNNTDFVIISKNPDFSNPSYVNLSNEDFYLRLEPGVYYWKADSGLIKGWSNQFEIDSDVGLGIERDSNQTKLVNIGNVKINVTKNEEGISIGEIVLEPDDDEIIEDNDEKYIGGQA